ncbi:hypothetical protein BJX61DRAFT_283609 [Aspergillus egyptiacus]|nr:hypothetical protein BJX61DRAFT_283609 [Aspergillus egyptiacus]
MASMVGKTLLVIRFVLVPLSPPSCVSRFKILSLLQLLCPRTSSCQLSSPHRIRDGLLFFAVKQRALIPIRVVPSTQGASETLSIRNRSRGPQMFNRAMRTYFPYYEAVCVAHQKNICLTRELRQLEQDISRHHYPAKTALGRRGLKTKAYPTVSKGYRTWLKESL